MGITNIIGKFIFTCHQLQFLIRVFRIRSTSLKGTLLGIRGLTIHLEGIPLADFSQDCGRNALLRRDWLASDEADTGGSTGEASCHRPQDGLDTVLSRHPSTKAAHRISAKVPAASCTGLLSGDRPSNEPPCQTLHMCARLEVSLKGGPTILDWFCCAALLESKNHISGAVSGMWDSIVHYLPEVRTQLIWILLYQEKIIHGTTWRED